MTGDGCDVKQPPRRDSRYWRAKAGEARTRAASFYDPDAKATMEDIAHGYDAMAERAERREKSGKGDGAIGGEARGCRLSVGVCKFNH